MKKLLASLTVLACILFASPALAGGYKVPKVLCFYTVGNPHQLTFKSLGSVSNETGKITLYSVNGFSYTGSEHFPVSGTAYIIPGTATLRATFSGMYGGTSRIIAFYNLTHSLASNSGSMQYRLDNTTGGITHNSVTTTGGDCAWMSGPAETD